MTHVAAPEQTQVDQFEDSDHSNSYDIDERKTFEWNDDRVEKAITKMLMNRKRIDSKHMRMWEVVMLLAISVSYIRCTYSIITTHTAFVETTAAASIGLALSVLFFIDVYIHTRYLDSRDRAQYGVIYHVFSVVTAIPWDVLLFLIEWMSMTRGQALGILSIQASRILLLPTLFHSDSPDIVDVHYIRFYYVILPKLRLAVFTLLSIHTLVICYIVSVGGDEEEYGTGVMWVWTIITSSPFAIDVRNDGETVLAGLLMLMSMLVQGYFVSAVSTILLGFSLQDQNRDHMLVTLEMLKYYKVPVELQEEVLSFQYHVLQDSSVHTQFAPELERLPPTMLLEIDLCVKIGVLDKVSLLDSAPHDCKRKLANVMKQRMIDPLTNIITVGEKGYSMYFLLHGLADVSLDDVVVATLRRGDFFGEIALLSSDAIRTATVCTLTYCDVLELKKRNFDKIIQNYPTFLEIVEHRRENVEEGVGEIDLQIVALDQSVVSHQPSSSGHTSASRSRSISKSIIDIKLDSSTAPTGMYKARDRLAISMSSRKHTNSDSASSDDNESDDDDDNDDDDRRRSSFFPAMIQQIKKRQRRKKQMAALKPTQLQPQHLSLPASSSSRPKRVIKSPLLSPSPHQSMMSGTAGTLDMSQMSFGALGGGGGTVPNSPRQSGRKTFAHAHTQTIAAGCFKGTGRVSNGITKTELQQLSAAVQDVRMSIVKTEKYLK